MTFRRTPYTPYDPLGEVVSVDRLPGMWEEADLVGGETDVCSCIGPYSDTCTGECQPSTYAEAIGLDDYDVRNDR
jgi:hypothetical protein